MLELELELEGCSGRELGLERNKGGVKFLAADEKNLDPEESCVRGKLAKTANLLVVTKVGESGWSDRGRYEKLLKSNLGSDGGEREKIKELTDLLASANEMFSVVARKRTILCLTTSGQSWDTR